MKKIVCAFAFCFLFCTTHSIAQTWTMVWHDEFDDAAINAQNWAFDTGTEGDGWGNNELEFYTSRPENSHISNGNLVITANKENYENSHYTSARLKTHGLQRWTYGKIEARIKLPFQQGLWPAFWLIGDTIDYIGFPYCGEVDIMEFIDKDPTLHGTMHWQSKDGLASYGGTIALKKPNAYHIYSIEWDTASIKWFLDGKEYWEGSIVHNVNQTDAFHRPFYILLNLAVGGGWPGEPDKSTHFPAMMYVDYVRVYERASNK
jgi:beta-glucanase (GH16 family)